MEKPTEYYFKRKKDLGNDSVSLDLMDLKILSLIEENNSLRQIKKALNIDADQLKKKITALYKKNVIILINEADHLMDPSFAEAIRAILLDLLGPVGPVLLDDVLERHGLDDDRIPQARVENIILEIARDIPDEEQSALFVTRVADKKT